MSTRGFGALTSMLVGVAADLCEGRILLTLEGGYDLKALGASVLATLGAMAGVAGSDERGVPPPDPPAAVAALERAVAFHRHA
jgi:acetoin utilization deacetylase AcuC-like enzyme